MGQEILYCCKCQSQIRSADFDKGKGLRIGNRACCSQCAPAVLAELSPQEQAEHLKQRDESRPEPKSEPPPARPMTESSHRIPRATVSPPRSPAGLIAALAGGAVLLLIAVLAVAFGSARPRPPPPAATAPDSPPPAVEPPEPADRRPEPGPPVKSREELRQEEARRNLGEVQALEKGGRFAADEIRRRYAEFAREYADTPEGRKIADWLKATEPKPEPPKIAEVPKPPEPKPEPPAPEPKPPEPEPVPKPPEPAAKPPAETPAVPARPKRPAVPEAARLREAEVALRKTFKIDGARSPEEKAALARELLQTATTSGAKDAELYVLLANARDLAAQAGEAKTALEAIDAMAAAFEVNAFEKKADMLTKIPVKGPDGVAWARTCLEVAEQAEEGGDYDSAVKLASRAETLASAAKDATLLSTAKDRSKELGELKRETDRLKIHFKTLETNGDDPAANTAVGRFLCLVKEDWGKGLPMLAKGSDEKLKELAKKELANPSEAEGQAALGEGWAAQARKEFGKYNAGAKARAAEWLEKAMPGLTGRVKDSAQKMLSSLRPPSVTKGPLILDLGGEVRMEFLYIKPGTFTMGGTEAPTEGWQRDERPPHKVELTRGYYIGKYEVTQAQWEAVMGSNPSHWKGPDLPVEQVSWEECQNFLREINKKLKSQLKGCVAGLPTEAQWEYACRAGTTTRWSFGDEEAKFGDYGWCATNSGGQTHPVGQKKPNPWGLYDMYGNVHEWCQDWHGPYGGDARDPEGPSSGSERCLRGGVWNGPPTHCRSARRLVLQPSYRDHGDGFRVVVR